jgi:response regulator RpfG family c-di-GMP phosphodiesterase
MNVLLVDDNECDRFLMRRALEGAGYRVLMANCSETGLEVLAQHDVRIVIADPRLPRMSGIEFLAAVRGLYPGVVRILASGSPDPGLATDAVSGAGIHEYISKDWDSERLRTVLRDAVGTEDR